MSHAICSVPRRALVTIVASCLVVACGQDVTVGDAASRGGREAPSGEVLAAVASPQLDEVSGIAAAPVGGQAALASTADSTAAPASASMLIRTGTAAVRVDSLELAIAAVRQMATRYGGFVGNTSLSAGEYNVRSATLEIKVPSARFDSLVSGLAPLGVVESVSQSVEDVGEEFVDVAARVANARRLEERLITLLQTRTGKLEDVLAVERELARVREEIDRYDGRLRYLKTRVAMSTLSVTVHERAPLVNPNPGQNVIIAAFTKAWQLFVRVVAGFIELLGIIIPVVALLALLLALRRRWRARRRSP